MSSGPGLNQSLSQPLLVSTRSSFIQSLPQPFLISTGLCLAGLVSTSLCLKSSFSQSVFVSTSACPNQSLSQSVLVSTNPCLNHSLSQPIFVSTRPSFILSLPQPFFISSLSPPVLASTSFCHDVCRSQSLFQPVLVSTSDCLDHSSFVNYGPLRTLNPNVSSVAVIVFRFDFLSSAVSPSWRVRTSPCHVLSGRPNLAIQPGSIHTPVILIPYHLAPSLSVSSSIHTNLDLCNPLYRLHRPTSHHITTLSK